MIWYILGTRIWSGKNSWNRCWSIYHLLATFLYMDARYSIIWACYTRMALWHYIMDRLRQLCGQSFYLRIIQRRVQNCHDKREKEMWKFVHDLFSSSRRRRAFLLQKTWSCVELQNWKQNYIMNCDNTQNRSKRSHKEDYFHSMSNILPKSF